MATETQNLVRIKNRPRLRTLEPTESERHASWLELFFDLVYVLAVSQIAHVLSAHTDLGGIIKYIALFLPVWWSWVGFTFYADRFESDETVYRISMFAGMLVVAALSLTFENAFSLQGDAPFVICYFLVRLVLVAVYARSAYQIPLARSLSLFYVAGFGIAAALWLVSLLFPPPMRYAIWAFAFTIEILTPLMNNWNVRFIPFDRSHIPERFGLFTIIVIGEAVIATANGAAKVEWNPGTITAASLGFAMAACIWWMNFDFVEDSAIRSNAVLPRFIYLYGHFFIVSSIVIIGIGVEHAIKETGEAHLHLPTLALLGGGIAVYLAIITILRLITNACYLVNLRLAAIAVSLSIIYIGQFLPPLAILGGLSILFAAGVWLETLYAGERPEVEEQTSHLTPCEHAGEIKIFEPNSTDGCEECVKNNYKWVHLRLCTSCGHVGCCDSSVYKHATKHFRQTDHPIMTSIEPGESWAWCYPDDRFVPLISPVGDEQGVE